MENLWRFDGVLWCFDGDVCPLSRGDGLVTVRRNLHLSMKISAFLLNLQPLNDGLADHLGDFSPLGHCLHPLDEFDRQVNAGPLAFGHCYV